MHIERHNIRIQSKVVLLCLACIVELSDQLGLDACGDAPGGDAPGGDAPGGAPPGD